VSALLLPLIPLVGMVAVIVTRQRPRTVGPIAVGALVATFGLAIWTAAAEPSFTWKWSSLLELGVAIEGFGRVMVILVPLIAAPIVAYAAVTEEHGKARLLSLMLAFVAAMLLLVVAADFLTLLFAWELVGASSWALIGHDWQQSENTESAARAFITTRIGDLGLYLAAGITFSATGSFAFASIGMADGTALNIIAAGVLLAAAAKSAQLPFSPWLFQAMAGPTPVSALLHSATLVASGAYLLIRLAPALEPTGWFLSTVTVIGLATALAGGVVAVIQTDAKRVLAGSTSAQYGLMFIAVGAGSAGAAGAHLVTHAAFKSLLFLGAGIAVHAIGHRQLAGMRLGTLLPRTAMLSGIGVLALAAVPPMGGAWTKEGIVAAAVHSSGWLGAGVLIAGFLSALYAARYQLLVFGRANTDVTEDGRRSRQRHVPSRVELGSLALLAGLTLLLSLLWLPGAAGLVEDLTGSTLIEGAPWELAAGVLVIVAAFAIVWLLARRQALLTMALPSGVQAVAGDWMGLPAVTSMLVERPVLAASGLLAEFDDRVIDAGVRLTASLARLVSRLFSLRVEWTIDGAVHAIANATMRTAWGSRRADDDGVDRAVEESARGIGRAGAASRRLQTGQLHQYYVMLAIGVAALLAALLWLG
jgi:NADH-quinone oxidoreductase subunit L